MKKNSLYDGQKIDTSEPGEQSPPDAIECSEDCPFCPESRSPKDCMLDECYYYIDPDTVADKKLHARRDEGEV